MGRRVKAAITPRQRSALQTLAPVLPAGTYLAGGVAVALRCSHRTSHDLDLFVPGDFDSAALVERVAAGVAGARVLGAAEGTVELDLEGTPAIVLRYRYPVLAPVETRDDLAVPIAAAADLVCMKLAALAGRGAARDFWDLHELILQRLGASSLPEALALYRRKFPSDDIGHVVRSLAYFSDAEKAPFPLGLDPQRWRQIKVDFQSWIRALE